MSIMTRSRWMKRLGIGTLALLGLGAVALQPTPANARVFVSLGVPAYGYYPYYPGYYGYPYGGVVFGFGGGHWHHWHHWR